MQTPDPIARAITARLAALQAAQHLSAWSLIVTFLGDAIGPRGGEVSAGAVQTLMERLGIGHGAVRTAMSRLAADGWVERSREGRNSFYRLSPGVARTVLDAERRIYAPSSLLPASTPRSMIVLDAPLAEPAARAFEEAGALRLASQVFLWLGDPARIPGSLPAALRTAGPTIAAVAALAPGPSMLLHLARARRSDEMSALRAAYFPVSAALEAGPPPAPEDAMTLRCLMIHEWRRLALRVIALPADLVQPDDPEPETRALVSGIYARLLAPSERWLDANGATPSGPLPPPDPRLPRRFGAA